MVGKKSLISGKSYTFFLISNYELSMKLTIFANDDVLTGGQTLFFLYLIIVFP